MFNYLFILIGVIFIYNSGQRSQAVNDQNIKGVLLIQEINEWGSRHALEVSSTFISRLVLKSSLC